MKNLGLGLIFCILAGVTFKKCPIFGLKRLFVNKEFVTGSASFKRISPLVKFHNFTNLIETLREFIHEVSLKKLKCEVSVYKM